jgi:hypothetical protein
MQGKVNMDDSHKQVICDMIQEFYLTKKTVPAVPKLSPVLWEKISWQWSGTSLTVVIRQMSFTWKKSQNKQVILAEQ